MKRIISITILTVLISLTSCEKVEPQLTEQNTFNAVVKSKGLDCGNTFLIEFNEDVQNLPNNTMDNIYYAINLPDEYKVEGTEINVVFRQPEDEEYIACTTMGTTYPQIYIISVD